MLNIAGFKRRAPGQESLTSRLLMKTLYHHNTYRFLAKHLSGRMWYRYISRDPMNVIPSQPGLPKLQRGRLYGKSPIATSMARETLDEIQLPPRLKDRHRQ